MIDTTAVITILSTVLFVTLVIWREIRHSREMANDEMRRHAQHILDYCEKQYGPGMSKEECISLHSERWQG